MRVARLIALIVLATSATGCETWYRLTHSSIPECDTDLVSTDSMGPDFWVLYQVRVRRSDIDQRFALVAEKTELGLALIAFNRFGTEIFSLRQVGTEVKLGGPVLPSFAPPPENVLGDLHRMRFLGEAESRGDGHRLVESCGTETIFVQIEERAIAAAN